MKTKEELSVLIEKLETLNKKLTELTDEELAQVSGGVYIMVKDGNCESLQWTDDFRCICPNTDYCQGCKYNI